MVIIAGLIMWGIALLLSLAHALERRDVDPVTRLTWVLVLILVPFFGIFLYWMIAPKSPQPRTNPSDQLSGTPWANNPGHTRSSKDT